MTLRIILLFFVCISCGCQKGSPQAVVSEAELDTLLSCVQDEVSQALEITLQTTGKVSSVRQHSTKDKTVDNVTFVLSGDYVKITGTKSVSREYQFAPSWYRTGSSIGTTTNNFTIEARKTNESNTGEYRLFMGEHEQIGWTADREYIVDRMGEIHVKAVDNRLL